MVYGWLLLWRWGQGSQQSVEPFSHLVSYVIRSICHDQP